MRLSVFKYRSTKTCFAGPKRFRGFRETGPWVEGAIVEVSAIRDICMHLVCMFVDLSND